VIALKNIYKNILVTGANGFIGKNLVSELRNRGYDNLFLYNRDSAKEQLDEFLRQCDFIFHLAGINRTNDEAEFVKGNMDFTKEIIEKLKLRKSICPIVVCSTTHVDSGSPYGKSKKAMEELVLSFSKEFNSDVYIYRLTNVFGKWCNINYNSVVATFCYNIARGLPIRIDDPDTMLNLLYVDDIVNEFILDLERKPFINEHGLCDIPTTYTILLKELAEKLKQYHENRNGLLTPSFVNDFDRKLYATYTSYLREDSFSYPLEMKEDNRGYFCECIKSIPFGQVSVSVTKPGIVRGNHWHQTKTEKFLALKGQAAIRFRKLREANVIEYFTSGEKLEIVDVPPGYTHSLENIGDDDLIMLIWSNEIFDPIKLDTWIEEV